MARPDAYAPCLCGSGKKFKFCCAAIAPEMDKIVAMQQDHHFRQALQKLGSIGHPDASLPWVLITRASCHLNLEEPSESIHILEQLLDSHPDHPLATALYATAMFVDTDYEEAHPAIDRALRKCRRSCPDLLGGLALGIAAFMMGNRHAMSARAHLALAMQLVPEEEQQDVFVRLLEFDSNVEIPYPLRSVHQLVAVPGFDEHQATFNEARHLTEIGCWLDAADLYYTVVEQIDKAPVWQNYALCLAWGGRDAEASDAFFHAAQREQDAATAVEYETLAQLLDDESTADIVAVRNRKYTVTSASGLLTALDNAVQFHRVEATEEDDERLAGLFLALDRPYADLPQQPHEWTIETVPNVLGQVSIYDSVGDEPATAFLVGFEGNNLCEARSLFADAVADKATLVEEADRAESVAESIPRELFPLHWRWFFPPAIPAIRRKELELQKWKQAIEETWPNTPLRHLDGKTPAQVVGDAQYQRQFMAAPYVLDAFVERKGSVLDFAAVLSRLQLQELPPYPTDEKTPFNALSAMQLQRLILDQLDDKQLVYVLNRALLLHHSRFLYAALTRVLKRPACAEQIDVSRAYATLADLAHEVGRRDECFEWLDKGLEHDRQRGVEFTEIVRWKLQQLNRRLEDPTDPVLTSLLNEFWTQYVPKLPQLEPLLRNLVDTFSLTPPWESASGIVTSTAGGPPPQGVWSPTGETTTTDPTKKLWIPGQS